jgi:deoxyribose-phosphate aldolase
MDDVADKFEHTVLGPTTEWEDVTDTLDAAIRYGMRACIPPCYVEQATEYAPNIELSTVVGFPHGQHLTETKCQEATQLRKAGAAEIDVVANVGRLLAGETEAVRNELEEVVAAVPLPVKVIVEAPLLDEERLHEVSQAAADANVAYLKTSTGFTEGGATVEDVAIMAEYLPVKASGGVSSWEFAQELFEVGAERIGTSSGDGIMAEYQQTQENQ